MPSKTSAFTLAKSVRFEWIVIYIAQSPIRLSIVLLTIPISGLAFEFLFQGSFGRSGSVLVAAAVLAVYINHFLARETEHLRGVYREARKMGSTESDIHRNINPEIPVELHPGIVASMKTVQNTAPKELETITNAGDKLVKAEFIAGLVGTLIWGFGDLIKYLPNLQLIMIDLIQFKRIID